VHLGRTRSCENCRPFRPGEWRLPGVVQAYSTPRPLGADDNLPLRAMLGNFSISPNSTILKSFPIVWSFHIEGELRIRHAHMSRPDFSPSIGLSLFEVEGVDVEFASDVGDGVPRTAVFRIASEARSEISLISRQSPGVLAAVETARPRLRILRSWVDAFYARNPANAPANLRPSTGVVTTASFAPAEHGACRLGDLG